MPALATDAVCAGVQRSAVRLQTVGVNVKRVEHRKQPVASVAKNQGLLNGMMAVSLPDGPAPINRAALLPVRELIPGHRGVS